MKAWEALAFFSSPVPGGPPWPRVLDEWELVARLRAAGRPWSSSAPPTGPA
ncbi:MAG: hypothetical protein MUF83_21425 [Acidimicrobiales bacterium]|nr:hypothetical protein [Acidimicrobiales bacterium]